MEGWILVVYINPQPKWSEFCKASFCRGKPKIVNFTHAFWSWLRNDNDESVKADDIWITSLVSLECVLIRRDMSSGVCL
ncbi:iron/zinc purple acid phosphatase-like protein C [Medicago truncatula]|uniref:Iron/zinc purple acid phosphatase-like protein C n=1 Tax=Medicago truncatula TaxID=3880 RepID=G7K8G2_MEDTR|nr:iron/zinc purple acid phosphatase-like protein C [Medicago truncatula]